MLLSTVSIHKNFYHITSAFHISRNAMIVNFPSALKMPRFFNINTVGPAFRSFVSKRIKNILPGISWVISYNNTAYNIMNFFGQVIQNFNIFRTTFLNIFFFIENLFINRNTSDIKKKTKKNYYANFF